MKRQLFINAFDCLIQLRYTFQPDTGECLQGSIKMENNGAGLLAATKPGQAECGQTGYPSSHNLERAIWKLHNSHSLSSEHSWFACAATVGSSHTLLPQSGQMNK